MMHNQQQPFKYNNQTNLIKVKDNVKPDPIILLLSLRDLTFEIFYYVLKTVSMTDIHLMTEECHGITLVPLLHAENQLLSSRP